MELPSYVQIEPVGQCNLRCRMCPIQFREDGPPFGPPAFMTFETFTALMDGLPTLRELHLQGLGEPLMHPRFFDMVSYAAARGVTVTTNSNLLLLNSRRAERAVSCGLSRMYVSIDGATEQTYERIRVRGRLDRLLRNVGLLVDTRSRNGGGLPRLDMVVVVMRQNLHELAGLVRLASELSMESVYVQHLTHDFMEADLPQRYAPMRDFVQQQTLLAEDPERIAEHFDRARAEAAERGLPLRLPQTRPRAHPPGMTGRARCDWPWRGPYISYQGIAMPCCAIATPDRGNFGNMAERGVADIWFGDDYRRFRAQLDSEEPPQICRTCSVYLGTF
jgi:MoaA/NifB/PqqE/SkfB family radical SAM enzyme